MIFDLPTVQMENLNISIGLDFFKFQQAMIK